MTRTALFLLVSSIQSSQKLCLFSNLFRLRHPVVALGRFVHLLVQGIDHLKSSRDAGAPDPIQWARSAAP